MLACRPRALSQQTAEQLGFYDKAGIPSLLAFCVHPDLDVASRKYVMTASCGHAGMTAAHCPGPGHVSTTEGAAAHRQRPARRTLSQDCFCFSWPGQCFLQPTGSVQRLAHLLQLSLPLTVHCLLQLAGGAPPAAPQAHGGSSGPRHQRAPARCALRWQERLGPLIRGAQAEPAPADDLGDVMPSCSCSRRVQHLAQVPCCSMVRQCRAAAWHAHALPASGPALHD